MLSFTPGLSNLFSAAFKDCVHPRAAGFALWWVPLDPRSGPWGICAAAGSTALKSEGLSVAGLVQRLLGKTPLLSGPQFSSLGVGGIGVCPSWLLD